MTSFQLPLLDNKSPNRKLSNLSSNTAALVRTVKSSRRVVRYVQTVSIAYSQYFHYYILTITPGNSLVGSYDPQDLYGSCGHIGQPSENLSNLMRSMLHYNAHLCVIVSRFVSFVFTPKTTLFKMFY